MIHKKVSVTIGLPTPTDVKDVGVNMFRFSKKKIAGGLEATSNLMMKVAAKIGGKTFAEVKDIHENH